MSSLRDEKNKVKQGIRIRDVSGASRSTAVKRIAPPYFLLVTLRCSPYRAGPVGSHPRRNESYEKAFSVLFFVTKNEFLQQ